ncbi:MULTISPECIES: hypothetical protein [Spirosoma]|uniref:Nuclease SbcCD subunit D C-terminal domain-containing protein n=1 Tax=Spirosoma liriopis TaxID=2937440 RepID=A0ABT0HHU2_9BACT|nr:MULTISPECIES: hypothetical protein [Spirosoma]MCK8491728.1 hypothetical protein [Spirosoma liriopis]UHG91086.1 hypothetical protein LQ777_22975 [Spirosoma oryzicola]
MDTPSKPNTSLSLTDSNGRELLQATLTDYVTFLRRQPAICGSAEQQEILIKHVAQGHELIKLVAAERLKITRELDKQKHDWMELEKELTAPIMAAMQPLKDAVEHYNKEMLRIREHQQAEAAQQATLAESGQTNWLTPEVAIVDKPKGVQMRWTYEIVDHNQIPNGYWKLDEAAIKADISHGVRQIPGVRIYEEAITTFRK